MKDKFEVWMEEEINFLTKAEPWIQDGLLDKVCEILDRYREIKQDKPSKESLAYIRDYYKVPAELGKVVEYDGKLGTIVGGHNTNVVVQLEGESWWMGGYHPTDLNYHPKENNEDDKKRIHKETDPN